MRIRTQFILTMLLFGVTLVIIAASAVIIHRALKYSIEQEEIAQNIARGAGELGYLTNEYLVYRESQQLQRWQEKFASFSELMGRLDVDKPEHRALVINLHANQRRLKGVFDSIVSALDNSSTTKRADLDPAFLQVSWSRMAVQSQGLVSDASRLSRLLDRQVEQLTESWTMLLYFLVGLFGLFLLISYMFTYRRILKSIAALKAGTQVISYGDLDYRIEEKKKDEIGDLARAFNQMAAGLKAVTASRADLEKEVTERNRAEEALRKAHGELEKRVQERTTELTDAIQRLQIEIGQRKRLEETLRESENQVRFFASQCLTAQETERRRIAGELHDSISASLAATKFGIERASEELKRGNAGPESLRSLAAKLAEVMSEVRRIMADLRPSILDDLGIVAAMNWFCREYRKSYSHISVEQHIGIEEHEVPDSLKTPIFRISQEAMNNIAKYSKASLVNLSLRKQDDKIQLTIQDDGQGFNLETVRKGLGFSTMRERAMLSGGECRIESVTGAGTTVQCLWPI